MSDIYRVKIIIAGGGTVHVMCEGPPAIYQDPETGRIDGSRFRPIADRGDADTLVAIDWGSVSVVAYRPLPASDGGGRGRPPETTELDVLRTLAREVRGQVESKTALADIMGCTRRGLDVALPKAVENGWVEQVEGGRGRVGLRLTEAGWARQRM